MLFNYAVKTSKIALNWAYFCNMPYITRKHTKSKLSDNDEHEWWIYLDVLLQKKEDSLGFIWSANDWSDSLKLDFTALHMRINSLS